MPIYEYKCRDCGHITEFLESFNSSAKHECENCGGENTGRQMSVFSSNVQGSESGGGSSSCSSCSSGSCSSCGL